MELQSYPLQRVLYVTTRGEASRRVAICVHESDTIAEVREAVQHALRAVPDFPKEVTITSIECEYEGEDYVLSDPIRVNQIFGTGTAKLKVQVGSFRGAGEQGPTVGDRSPCRTIARSPAISPFLTRTIPLSNQKTVAQVSSDGDLEVLGNSHPVSLSKQKTVAQGSSDDDVEVIGNSDPVSRSVPVPSINASKDHVDDAVRSRPYTRNCKSLFQSIDPAQSPLRTHPVLTDVPEFQDADIPAGNLPSLTPLSACPSPQTGTTTSELLEKRRNSVLDVTQLPLQETAGETGGPVVLSVQEDLQQEPEQGNQHLCGTPQKQGTLDLGATPQKQGNQDLGSTPQKRGTGDVSGTGNQDSGSTPQKEGTPRGENMPSKSPQKLNRFLCTAEHQPSAVKPTGSQDTNGSCETASRPYRRPSKRKLGAEVDEIREGFVNGGPFSPSSRRRGSRGDHILTAVESLEQEPVITLNASDQRAAESNGIPIEALDTIVATEACRQETADGKRRKKRKSKRNKQDTVDEQPVSTQEPEDAVVTLGSLDGDSHGKEGHVMDEPPPQDTQASQRLDDGEEHRVETVPKTFAQTDTNGVCESEHPESTPTSKKRRRLTKKHQNDGPEGSPVAQALSPRREDSTREGPKVSLSAFVAEEHLPNSAEGPGVETQVDTTGGVSNLEQGHIPQIVQDERLAGTPVRSSPRRLKKPVVETAIGNKEGAPQENREKQFVESAGENNRPVEKPAKKKRASGKRKKKGEQGRNRQMESLMKEMEPEVSDSHAYSPNVSSKGANGEEDLSDGSNGGTVTPRNSKRPKDKEKDKSTEKKQVADGDQARVPCRYKRLGCQRDYLYKTSAYYLHCRSCVYKGDCPSP